MKDFLKRSWWAALLIVLTLTPLVALAQEEGGAEDLLGNSITQEYTLLARLVDDGSMILTMAVEFVAPYSAAMWAVMSMAFPWVALFSIAYAVITQPLGSYYNPFAIFFLALLIWGLNYPVSLEAGSAGFAPLANLTNVTDKIQEVNEGDAGGDGDNNADAGSETTLYRQLPGSAIEVPLLVNLAHSLFSSMSDGTRYTIRNFTAAQDRLHGSPVSMIRAVKNAMSSPFAQAPSFQAAFRSYHNLCPKSVAKYDSVPSNQWAMVGLGASVPKVFDISAIRERAPEALDALKNTFPNGGDLPAANKDVGFLVPTQQYFNFRMNQVGPREAEPPEYELGTVASPSQLWMLPPGESHSYEEIQAMPPGERRRTFNWEADSCYDLWLIVQTGYNNYAKARFEQLDGEDRMVKGTFVGTEDGMFTPIDELPLEYGDLSDFTETMNQASAWSVARLSYQEQLERSREGDPMFGEELIDDVRSWWAGTGESIDRVFKGLSLETMVPIIQSSIGMFYGLAVLAFPVASLLAIVPGNGSKVLFPVLVMLWCHISLLMIYVILILAGLVMNTIVLTIATSDGVFDEFIGGLSMVVIGFESGVYFGIAGAMYLAYMLIEGGTRGLRGGGGAVTSESQHNQTTTTAVKKGTQATVGVASSLVGAAGLAEAGTAGLRGVAQGANTAAADQARSGARALASGARHIGGAASENKRS